MSQDKLIKIQCSKCKANIKYTTKNKKTTPEKLALQKFCKKCKGQTLFKEGKK
ncbi:MAG: 50S ribosomal protein L33 [Minisyncoccia bacterium]